MDRKRRLFRLIELYINDFRGDEVQEFYGDGSKIKIHTMTYSITNKTLLFEIVVKLGNSIQEEYMDNEMANVLLQEAIVYFFPEHRVSSYVRFDV
jgi:hypothetical protein